MNKDKPKQLKEILEIQGADGNWNYNGYMLGMYNGLELAVSIMEGRDPEYRNAPDEWLEDKKPKSKPTAL